MEIPQNLNQEIVAQSPNLNRLSEAAFNNLRRSILAEQARQRIAQIPTSIAVGSTALIAAQERLQ